MTERRDSLWVWYGNLRQRDHFEDLGVDGKIILKWVFTKYNGERRLIWLRKAAGGGPFKRRR